MDRTSLSELLNGPFDLSGHRERAVRSFRMETRYLHFAPSGSRRGEETYALTIRYVPAAEPTGDRYVCSELRFQSDDTPAVSIPEISDLTYAFDPSLNGVDGRGPMWGIPQDRFESLTDGAGNALPFKFRYPAYVGLLDFHSINDVFSQPLPIAGSVRDLKKLGQRTVHPASFVEAPVNFGSEIKPGSTFRNGEVSLQLDGLSVIDGSVCALIVYDAGESSLRMITPDVHGQSAVTVGRSFYRGSIYLDLATRWVRRASLDEYQVVDTTIAGETTAELTVRHIRLLAA